MYKNDSGFTFIEVMLSLVLLAIVGTILSSVFMNNIGVIQISKNRSNALNTVKNEINHSILDYNGLSQSITLVFNEGLSDEISIDIDGQLISETESYTTLNGDSSDVTLEYIEVVVP